MIDLTPLDVRKKRGDFRKGLRGYDPQEVDTFLEIVADRLEALVKENVTLAEKVGRLTEQVDSQEGRLRAVQEALVTAQELREEVRVQSEKEADLLRKQAEADAENLLADARRRVQESQGLLREMERQRIRFLRGFRSLLEREMDALTVEEDRIPLDGISSTGAEEGAERHHVFVDPIAPLSPSKTLNEMPDPVPAGFDSEEGAENGRQDVRDEPTDGIAASASPADQEFDDSDVIPIRELAPEDDPR